MLLGTTCWGQARCLVPAGTLSAEDAFLCNATRSQSHIEAGTQRRGRECASPHQGHGLLRSSVSSRQHPQTQFLQQTATGCAESGPAHPNLRLKQPRQQLNSYRGVAGPSRPRLGWCPLLPLPGVRAVQLVATLVTGARGWTKNNLGSNQHPGHRCWLRVRDPRDPVWRTKPAAGKVLFLSQAPPRLSSLLPLLTPLASSPRPAEVTRAEGNPATSLGMGNCGRKVLWALGFLLLLGSSSAQDIWEALLPARLAEKSRVSARRGGGASVAGGGPEDTSPQMLWSLIVAGVSCVRAVARGGKTGPCPLSPVPEDPFLPARRQEIGPPP